MVNISERLGNNPIDKIRQLDAVRGKLKYSDANFANDLINNFRRWGSLTPKQMAWVDTLIQRSACGGEAPNQVKAVETLEIPGFSAVEAMLYEAAKRIEFPAIRCLTTLGEKLVLRPAKSARATNVTFNGERRGRIIQEHYPANMATESLIKMLRQLAADPVQTARSYGRETSTCCFCGLGLQNPSSVYHGYGPICAENYGLPWGDVPLSGMAADLAKEFAK